MLEIFRTATYTASSCDECRSPIPIGSGYQELKTYTGSGPAQARLCITCADIWEELLFLQGAPDDYVQDMDQIGTLRGRLGRSPKYRELLEKYNFNVSS